MARRGLQNEAIMKIEQRLEELGIVLPPPSTPGGTYARTVRVGDLLYVSGTGPIAGPRGHQGKLGQSLTVEEGYEAARSVGIRVLATLKEALEDLDRMSQLVKTLGMVNATPDFADHAKVVNGYSDLFVDVFGEKAGKGVRSAVGMSSLPGKISVEIESLFLIG